MYFSNLQYLSRVNVNTASHLSKFCRDMWVVSLIFLLKQRCPPSDSKENIFFFLSTWLSALIRHFLLCWVPVRAAVSISSGQTRAASPQSLSKFVELYCTTLSLLKSQRQHGRWMETEIVWGGGGPGFFLDVFFFLWQDDNNIEGGNFYFFLFSWQ